MAPAFSNAGEMYTKYTLFLSTRIASNSCVIAPALENFREVGFIRWHPRLLYYKNLSPFGGKVFIVLVLKKTSPLRGDVFFK